MTQLINNPWIVGIGGGILSGFIVTVVSRALLSRRDRREYLQKISSANREVIYALRASIPEGAIPSKDVVDALINATARKYSVERKDVYDSKEIAEELIKEVMDSSFISAKMKEDYCQRLGGLVHPPVEARSEPLVLTDKVRVADVSQYRTRMITMMSVMMGLTAAMMTILLAFVQFRDRLDTESKPIFPKETISLLFPALLSVLAVTVASAVMMFYRDLKERGRISEPREKKSTKETDDTSQSSKDAT